MWNKSFVACYSSFGIGNYTVVFSKMSLSYFAYFQRINPFIIPGLLCEGNEFVTIWHVFAIPCPWNTELFITADYTTR